jgi:hypothetical protein
MIGYLLIFLVILTIIAIMSIGKITKAANYVATIDRNMLFIAALIIGSFLLAGLIIYIAYISNRQIKDNPLETVALFDS